MGGESRPFLILEAAMRHDRLSDKEDSDDCCGLAGMSWEEHQRQVAAAKRAQNTPMTVETGYQGEAMDPDDNIGMKPWSGKK